MTICAFESVESVVSSRTSIPASLVGVGPPARDDQDPVSPTVIDEAYETTARDNR
jgi:hypothetical protein